MRVCLRALSWNSFLYHIWSWWTYMQISPQSPHLVLNPLRSSVSSIVLACWTSHPRCPIDSLKVSMSKKELIIFPPLSNFPSNFLNSIDGVETSSCLSTLITRESSSTFSSDLPLLPNIQLLSKSFWFQLFNTVHIWYRQVAQWTEHWD